MNNVFDLKGDQRPCTLFCRKQLDKAQKQRPYEIMDRINQRLQGSFSKILQKAGFISFLFGMLLVFLSTLIGTASGALWLQIVLCVIGILFLSVSLFVTVYVQIKQSRFLKSDEYVKLTQQQNEAFLQNLRALGIPDDAFDGMSVMFRVYRTENGKEAPVLAEDQFLLDEYYAYGDAECFYLAENSRVFAFPRAEIVALKHVKQEVRLLRASFGREEDLCAENLSCIIANRPQKGAEAAGYPLSGYFCLQLLHEGNAFEILFPEHMQKNLYALLDIH